MIERNDVERNNCDKFRHTTQIRSNFPTTSRYEYLPSTTVPRIMTVRQAFRITLAQFVAIITEY